MKNVNKFQPNPKYDLVLERVVDVPKELMWKALTNPEHVKKWFVPKPWSIVECEIDLQPGGRFKFTMQSPEGEKFPNMGCYLEIVENEKVVWTSALQPGYRPAPAPTNPHDLPFTAMILIESQGSGTKYTAIAIHGAEETRNTHEKMGFHEGWGTCFDQMVEMIKAGKI